MLNVPGVTDRPSNRLLARLSPDDRAILEAAFVPFDFGAKFSFARPNEPLDYAYFLDDGIASLVVYSPEGQRTEGGVIGYEGFVVPAIIMGSDRAPYDVQGQVPGRGQRIPCAALREAAEARPAIRELLLRFAYVMSVQTSYTLLSNAVHQLDERLARWLLMCHDRSHSDDLALTHEFMSLMLSVRRPSVTTTLHVLEGNGFIRSERGYVQIRDRRRLEEFAGDAYGKPEAEYRRLFPS